MHVLFLNNCTCSITQRPPFDAQHTLSNDIKYLPSTSDFSLLSTNYKYRWHYQYFGGWISTSTIDMAAILVCLKFRCDMCDMTEYRRKDLVEYNTG